MPRFTQFGVWEKEVKGFIKQLAAANGDEKILTDWMYTKGIAVFIESQSQWYRAKLPDLKRAIKQRNNSDVDPNFVLEENNFPVDKKFMEENKKIAFLAMYQALLERFIPNENTKAVFEVAYENLLKTAIENHQKFYVIQAYITNAVLHLDESKTLAEVRNFTDEQFNHFKTTKPELALEIEAHQVLMSEFVAYLKARDPKVTEMPYTLWREKFLGNTSAADKQLDGPQNKAFGKGVG